MKPKHIRKIAVSVFEDFNGKRLYGLEAVRAYHFFDLTYIL